MNATASAITRIAGIALVLILAAILGLVAGNVLNARSDGAGVGAGGAGLPHMSGFDGARYSALRADDAVNPSYADPYRAHLQAARADAPDAIFPNVWGNVADDGSDAGAPTSADPYRAHIRAAGADTADAVFPNVWGNVESGNEAAAGSATAPTLR